MAKEKATETTALAVPPNEYQALDAVVEQHLAMQGGEQGVFGETFLLARAVSVLHELITPSMMEDVMWLQGKRLGFRTDKQYDMEAVKSCLIEAVLQGLRPTGNEFNIIANGVYVTKEGYTRLLREYPGLTDLKLDIGIPRVVANGQGALVKCGATWNLNGEADRIEAEIPVKGSGADQIIGKAERKLRHRIYGQITGSQSSMMDGDVDDARPLNVVPMTELPKTNGAKAQLGLPAPPETQPAPDEDSESEPPEEEPSGESPPEEDDDVFGG